MCEHVHTMHEAISESHGEIRIGKYAARMVFMCCARVVVTERQVVPECS